MKSFEPLSDKWFDAGVSWDEMLKMTTIKLEFIPYPDMDVLFENGDSLHF